MSFRLVETPLGILPPLSPPARGGEAASLPLEAFLPSAAFAPYNFNPYNVYQVPFQRFNIYGAARYEISDAIEVYTRGLFAKNTIDTIIAPSGAFGISAQLNLNNPSWEIRVIRVIFPA